MNKENQEELQLNEEISPEELAQVMAEMGVDTEVVRPTSDADLISAFEYLELDDEELSQIVNTKEYIEGAAISAKLLGIFLPLVNSGMPIKTCSDIVLNHMTLAHNFNLQVEINESNVKISENTKKMINHNSL